MAWCSLKHRDNFTLPLASTYPSPRSASPFWGAAATEWNHRVLFLSIRSVTPHTRREGEKEEMFSWEMKKKNEKKKVTNCKVVNDDETAKWQRSAEQCLKNTGSTGNVLFFRLHQGKLMKPQFT
jgi:hypothetical protein